MRHAGTPYSKVSAWWQFPTFATNDEERRQALLVIAQGRPI
jgi:hypothetical protein